jgi:glycerol-3-phosphate acyltransferase PlsY
MMVCWWICFFILRKMFLCSLISILVTLIIISVCFIPYSNIWILWLISGEKINLNLWYYSMGAIYLLILWRHKANINQLLFC